MTDTITISGIHPEVRQMSVILSIEGATYPKTIPLFDTQDAAILSAQLQVFAQELRGEFDALRASTQAADASAGASAPAVADAVNALVGTSIPVDTTPAPAPAPAPVPTDTSAGTAAPPPSETTPPTS